MSQMKLACVRCKNKKIKCDRAPGTCHQCVLASTPCVYVERKKRPRLAQQKQDVKNLARRLEYVEKRFVADQQVSLLSPQTGREESLEESTPPQSSPSPPRTSDTEPITAENGQESWIFRLASDAKRNFERVNTDCFPSPANSPATCTVDTAMSALGEALQDLGKLRIRSKPGGSDREQFNFTPEMAKKCMKAFMKLLNNVLVPGLVPEVLDQNILYLMPDIAHSPFVQVDPGMKVVYYTGLYFGTHCLEGPSDQKQAQAAYFKSLEAVPEWLDSAKGTIMDAQIACLAAWSAINNFDYQLSWKFHCKACQFVQRLGIDQIDQHPAKTSEEERSRHVLRVMYWHIVQTDLLFRLFYGKPSAMQGKTRYVQPPSLFNHVTMHPSAVMTTLYVIWYRFCFLTSDLFNALDALPKGNPAVADQVSSMVDTYCVNLEDIIIEWDLEALILKPDTRGVESSSPYMYGDHVMNVYSSIIGIKRLTRRPDDSKLPDAITLKAARKVISLIMYFKDLGDDNENDVCYTFVNFVSFYPFCAVFALYEFILSSPNPDDCEEDMRSLEALGIAMKESCEKRPDFITISNTINALNKVCRSTQDRRREDLLKTSPNSLFTPPASSLATTPQTSQQVQEGVGMDGIAQAQTFDSSFQLGLGSDSLGGVAAGVGGIGDFPMSLDGSFEPFGFVRAMENDFMGRNWHEPWWDMNGDMDTGLSGDLASGT